MSEVVPSAVRYVLTVYATVPCDDDGHPAYTAREMEKHLFHVLRKADADCDLECLEAINLDADGEPKRP